MVQMIIYGSLVLILILFIFQSMLLRRRNNQVNELVKQIKELDKQAGLGRLLTGIAHDLNTPIGALGCAMQTRNTALTKLRTILNAEGGAESDLAGVKKIFKALDETKPVVDESMDRTLDMINHLRKAGRGEPEGPVVIAVHEVMDRMLGILGHSIKNSVSIINEVNTADLVKVQPGELGRVFANVLSNSFDAMGGKGSIRISSRRQGDTVCIIIADNGPGFPTCSMESLFCSGWTTKNGDQGSGLGLYISQEIMNSFGGTISAANGENGGAEMTLCLPLALEAAQ